MQEAELCAQAVRKGAVLLTSVRPLRVGDLTQMALKGGRIPRQIVRFIEAIRWP